MPRKARKDRYLKYAALVTWLKVNHWRKQEHDWIHEKRPDFRIEWWNHGEDFVCVAVEDANSESPDAILLKSAGGGRAAANLTRRVVVQT